MGGPPCRASAQRPIFTAGDAYLSAEQEDDQDRGDHGHPEQRVRRSRLPLVLPEPRPRTVARMPPLGRHPVLPLVVVAHLICLPEIARATTSRWISDVPSKIV